MDQFTISIVRDLTCKFNYVWIFADKKDRENLSQSLQLSKDLLKSIDEQVDAFERRVRLEEIYTKMDSKSTTLLRNKKFKVGHKTCHFSSSVFCFCSVLLGGATHISPTGAYLVAIVLNKPQKVISHQYGWSWMKINNHMRESSSETRVIELNCTLMLWYMY